MQIPNVLFFDVAETLLDLAEPVGRVYTRFGKTAGLNLEEEMVTCHLRESFVGLPDPAPGGGDEAEVDWWRQLVRETFSRCGEEGAALCKSSEFETFFRTIFDFYASREAWTLYDDTLPALEKARDASLRLGVISNFDDRLFPILDVMDLGDFFEVIVNSSGAGCRKPSTEIFHKACSLLEVEPESCLHIGDSLERDYKGAKNAGLQAHHLQRPSETLLDVLEQLI